MNKQSLLANVLAVSLATGSLVAIGAEQEREDQIDIQALDNAKISLIDAINAAQKATTGKVMAISFASKNGNSVYEVDVAAKDGTTTSVEIDAQTGKVVQSKADNEQGETENDEADAD